MAFLTYTKPLRTNYTIFLKRKNSQIADIVEKNVPLRALPRTHRPSTSEGMPHPRNFLSGFPVSPSYPFILAFFFFFPTFWGTGFLFLAQLPLYLYTILKFLSAEFPQVLNLFLPRSIFPNFVSHSRDGCEIRVHCYYFVEALYITGSTQWHRPTGSWSTRKVCVGLEPPCWTRSIGIQHGSG